MGPHSPTIAQIGVKFDCHTLNSGPIVLYLRGGIP